MSGRRRRAVRVVAPAGGASGPAEINVTPLVDIVLVLLIIFMVMTPLAANDLTIRLVGERRSEQPTASSKAQIIVFVEASRTLVNAAPTSPSAYVAALRDLLSARQAEDRVVFVRADDGAPYPSVVRAIDGAKRAGATTVGFAVDATAAPSRPGG